MGTVTFVLGYCGSGKSHLADEMERNGIRKWDEGFAYQTPENTAKLAQGLRQGPDYVVVEIAFCD